MTCDELTAVTKRSIADATTAEIASVIKHTMTCERCYAAFMIQCLTDNRSMKDVLKDDPHVREVVGRYFNDSEAVAVVDESRKDWIAGITIVLEELDQ